MKTRIFSWVISLLLALGSNTVRSATITWTNTAGGNWSATTNWSPNQVPGSNDTANITTAGTYAVALNVNANVNDLTIGGAASGVQTLEGKSFSLVATNATVSSGGILNLTNSTLSGSMLVGSGAMLMVDSVTFGAQVTVANGGELLLVGSSSTLGLASPGGTNYWVTVQSGGVVDSASGAGMTLDSAVTNAGTINLTNSTFNIYNYPGYNGGTYNGGLVNEAGGTINLWASADITGTTFGGEYLINQGAINLGSGSSTINVDNLTSQGTVATLSGSGTLLIEQFNGLGSLAGSFNAAAGTIIKIGASASPGTSAGAGLTLGGAGQYQFVSGLLTLTTNVIPNLQYTGGTLALGASFQGGAITNLTLDGISLTNTLPVTGTLVMTNGTFYGSVVVGSGAMLMVDSVTFGAQVTVANGGELLLVGSSSTLGLASPGGTNYWVTVQSGGVVDSASGAGMTLDSAVTNAGVMNLTNSTITMNNYPGYNGGTYNGGLVNEVGGTINLWASAGITGTTFGGEYLINQGTINLGSGSSTINVDNLTSQGTVATLSGSGTLLIEQFNGLGSLAGSFNAAAGTIIQFGATASPGTSAGAGLTLGGAGQYQFVSGLLTLPNNTIPGLEMKGGTLALGASFQGGAITDLTLNGISLTNTLPVTGTLVMTNGTFYGSVVVGSGAMLMVDSVTFGAQVTVANGGELLLVGSSSTLGLASPGGTNYWVTVQSGGVVDSASGAGMTLDSAVTNAGVMNLTNSTITMNNYPGYNGGTYSGGLVNEAGGTINLWASADITGTTFGGEYLINQGAINLGSGSSTINVDNLTSQGTVATLSGSGTLLIEQFNGLGSLAGSFTAAAGTIIQIGASASPGTSAGAGLTLGGAGQYQFVSGLLTLATNVIPGLVMKGDTLALGANFQGGAITNLTLDGISLTNTLPVTGTFVMTNGTLYGSMVVDSGAVLTVDGVKVGAQVTVANGGELLLVGSSSTLGLGAAGDTNYWLTVQSGGVFDSASGAGILLESVVTNAGVMNLTNSTMNIYNYPGYGGGTYVGGLVNESGGTINLWASADITGTTFGGEYLINQGTISVFSTNNTSTINVDNFTNSATLSAQHGTMQLEGTHLNLQPAGTFSVGLSSNTDFGSITYNNTAALNLAQAGTFVVTLNGGYVPAVGSSFKVLSASSSGTFSGDFANFSSPSGAIWKTNYTATSLILTNVGQITWTTPSSITYGTALGGSQLNASTTPSVAGAFVYNPVAGTVLDSGAGQLLTATFDPSVTGDASASLQVTITVLKAPLGVTATNQSKTYGQNFAFAGTEFVPTGLVNGDTVTSASLASAGAISNAPVSGSPYAITITNALGDAGLTNYIITYTNGTLTVNPAPLGITANSTSKTYGQNITFAGTEFVPTGLQNLETVGTVTLTSAGAISNAPVSGSPYSITPSAATSGTFTPGNYAITYTNGTLTVNRAGLAVTANNAARNYGVVNPAFSASYSGFVNNENASVVSGVPGFSTPATVASDVGIYAITPLLGTLSAANYSFGPFDPGTLTINPAALSITASNQSKIYGQKFVFAGTEFATSGLVNGDSVTSASLASAGAITNAPVSGSPYVITITNALGDAGLTNYTISYFNGALTVNRAGLAVTANNAARNYGVANPAFSASYSGFVNNENASAVSGVPGFSTPATVASDVGVYAITPLLGTLSAANYSFGPFNPGTLTINPAALSITASNQSKTYGQTFTFAGTEFATIGLVNGDSVTSASLASAGAIPTAPVSGSPYAITVANALGDAGLTNYNISYFNGALTVNQATLTITADSTNKIVGEAWTFAGTEFTASGLQNSETVGTVTLTSAGAPAAAVAGPYNIVPSAPTGGTFSQGNYSDIFVDGTLTVYGQPELFLTTIGNQYVLTFQTVPGQMYQLESKTNLAVVGWSSLGGSIPGTGGIVNVTNTIVVPLSFFELQISP